MAGRSAASGAIARLVDSADFERVLRTRSSARSPHFALHHEATDDTVRRNLSTSGGQMGLHPVDDLCVEGAAVDVGSCRLGAVVPKRHARRAVTRSMLKRQIYSVAGRHLAGHARGCWVVRLRAPFARADFPSAASDALRLCARAELESLFSQLPPPGAERGAGAA